MEAGLGANHNCWQAVDTSLAKTARVITYDRPGYLNSDSCHKRRDAVTVARELKEALQLANIDPPYILVGWSLGGSFIRVFSGLYPQDVLGLVLVDPAPEESYARFKKECPEVIAEDSLYLAEVLVSKRTGERGEVLAFDSTMNQARVSDGKYSGPVILLIASYGKGFGKFVNDPNNRVNQIWVEELIKWSWKRDNIRYKIIDSRHHMAKDRPGFVVGSVLELINQLVN
jgi:pimeloyl-ACP methyl ester carboxylesterase